MTEQRFWTLISLKLSGDAHEEELDELSHFLRDRPEMRLRAATMETFWNSHAPALSNQREEAFERHLMRLKSQSGSDL